MTPSISPFSSFDRLRNTRIIDLDNSQFLGASQQSFNSLASPSYATNENPNVLEEPQTARSVESNASFVTQQLLAPTKLIIPKWKHSPGASPALQKYASRSGNYPTNPKVHSCHPTESSWDISEDGHISNSARQVPTTTKNETSDSFNLSAAAYTIQVKKDPIHSGLLMRPQQQVMNHYNHYASSCFLEHKIQIDSEQQLKTGGETDEEAFSGEPQKTYPEDHNSISTIGSHGTTKLLKKALPPIGKPPASIKSLTTLTNMVLRQNDEECVTRNCQSPPSSERFSMGLQSTDLVESPPSPRTTRSLSTDVVQSADTTRVGNDLQQLRNSHKTAFAATVAQNNTDGGISHDACMTASSFETSRFALLDEIDIEKLLHSVSTERRWRGEKICLEKINQQELDKLGEIVKECLIGLYDMDGHNDVERIEIPVALTPQRLLLRSHDTGVRWIGIDQHGDFFYTFDAADVEEKRRSGQIDHSTVT